MRELFTKESLTVASGQAISGIARQAQTLRVASGRVWLTEEGMPHDYWLCAGETFAVTPGRLVVIEADAGASRIELTSARRRSVWNRLGKLMIEAMQRPPRSRNIVNSLRQRSRAAQPRQLRSCS